jgi:hypothetical protein
MVSPKRLYHSLAAALNPPATEAVFESMMPQPTFLLNLQTTFFTFTHERSRTG